MVHHGFGNKRIGYLTNVILLQISIFHGVKVQLWTLVLRLIIMMKDLLLGHIGSYVSEVSSGIVLMFLLIIKLWESR